MNKKEIQQFYYIYIIIMGLFDYQKERFFII